MKYVIANWKMYLDTRGGVALVRELLRSLRGKDILPEVVVCPNFLSLGELKKVLARSRVHLGAQDAFWEDEGAHTGFVGPKMLKDAGCTHVILGHSERRVDAGETLEMISRKLSLALRVGLVPVLCVGRDAKKELEVMLEHVSAKDAARLIITYEPPDAISARGQGAEDPKAVAEVLSGLREVLSKRFPGAGARIPLLYGGSVDGENAYTFLREDAIDGVLVGHASAKVHALLDIVAAALKAMKASL